MSCGLAIASNVPSRSTLDVQLRRYHRGYRRRLRKLAKTSRQLKDLIYTFPGAAFSIAAGHGNPLLRAEAVNLVQDGASLREIGKVLGLPVWVRRLPPEAFLQALGKIPGGDDFARRISNTVPQDPAQCSMWLQWVLRANALCDEEFAIWIARQHIWLEHDRDPSPMLPLAAYAWYSSAEKTTARGLIERPWTANTGFAKALEAARSWFVRCLSEYCSDSQGYPGHWFARQRSSGLRIVPLRTPDELIHEGKRMRHCVGDYACQVLSGACLIYSIRRGNQHVATLEVRPHWERQGQPVMAQLRGPDNDPVDEDIDRAVERWLARQGHYPFAGTGQFARLPFNSERWSALWAPYREEKNDRKLAIQPLQVQLALDELSRYA
ncbi:MAG: PcfJ domain-containing protein [Hyphomicrobiaceae bacterium]